MATIIGVLLVSRARIAAEATRAEQEADFRANKAAWTFWESQPPGYRRTATFWVTSAKQEATRLRRLRTLIEDSAAGRRIALLAPRPKRD